MKNIITGNIETGYVFIDGVRLYPTESQKIYNHSLDGFSWGYGGSGPAQLALAILLKFTTKRIALSLHQNFKWEVIAKLPQMNFETKFDISEWLASKIKVLKCLANST